MVDKTSLQFYTNGPSCADGYKVSHHEQYPKGTSWIVSNMTPRSSRIPEIKEVVFYGLQAYMERILNGMWKDFFKNPEKAIAKYGETVRTMLGNENYSTDHFHRLAKLGYFPIKIRALKEGTRVPLRTPLLTVENNCADFFWLPNFIETQISDEIWGMITSATIADQYRKVFDKYAELTGVDPEFVEWQGHDFSMRGMWGIDAAAKSGSAHLLSFRGTDTIPAIQFAQAFYKADKFVGGTVPATEHSVMCAGGSEEGSEILTFLRLLEIYPTGILSVVSDTWDFWKVITQYLPKIKDHILGRNGKLVIRPDSGDPVKILVGDPDSNISHVRKGLIEVLWDIFGGFTNSKGFRVLDSHIGAIYGDSITLERQRQILEGLYRKGFATNIVLGLGSFTYQYVTRDTFGFAIKATAAVIDGELKALYKAPKTDDGTKNSARGLIYVYRDKNGKIAFEENVSIEMFESKSNLLEPVYENGKILRKQKFEDIRNEMKRTRSHENV